MHPLATISLLLASASLPLLTVAAPARTIARTSSIAFRDSHGSGWEFHTYRRRAATPAAATAAPEPIQPPFYIPVPVAKDPIVKREAESNTDPSTSIATGVLPNFFAPIPDTKINGPLIKEREAEPQAAPVATIKPGSNAQPIDTAAGASALPGFFAPIPSFKVTGALKEREANPEAMPEPEPVPEPEAELIDGTTSGSSLPEFLTPIPTFKTSGILKDREAEAEANAEADADVDDAQSNANANGNTVNLIAPIPNLKFTVLDSLKEREAEAEPNVVQVGAKVDAAIHDLEIEARGEGEGQAQAQGFNNNNGGVPLFYAPVPVVHSE